MEYSPKVLTFLEKSASNILKQATERPADLTRLSPQWSDKAYLIEALTKHLSNSSNAIGTEDQDSELTDLALVANAYRKSQIKSQMIKARLNKFREEAAALQPPEPQDAMQKVAGDTGSYMFMTADRLGFVHNGRIYENSARHAFTEDCIPKEACLIPIMVKKADDTAEEAHEDVPDEKPSGAKIHTNQTSSNFANKSPEVIAKLLGVAKRTAQRYKQQGTYTSKVLHKTAEDPISATHASPSGTPPPDDEARSQTNSHAALALWQKQQAEKNPGQKMDKPSYEPLNSQDPPSA